MRWVLLSLTLLALGCAHAQTAQIPSEEYAVYAAVISAEFQPRDGGPVYLSEETTDGMFGDAETIQRLRVSNPPVADAATIDAFAACSSQVTSFELALPASVEVVLQSDEAPWPPPHAGPGLPGLVAFSRVGLNPDATEAIVYASQYYGPLAARGFLVILRKEQGVWRVVNTVDLWIS